MCNEEKEKLDRWAWRNTRELRACCYIEIFPWQWRIRLGLGKTMLIRLRPTGARYG